MEEGLDEVVEGVEVRDVPRRLGRFLDCYQFLVTPPCGKEETDGMEESLTALTTFKAQSNTNSVTIEYA